MGGREVKWLRWLKRDKSKRIEFYGNDIAWKTLTDSMMEFRPGGSHFYDKLLKEYRQYEPGYETTVWNMYDEGKQSKCGCKYTAFGGNRVMACDEHRGEDNKIEIGEWSDNNIYYKLERNKDGSAFYISKGMVRIVIPKDIAKSVAESSKNGRYTYNHDTVAVLIFNFCQDTCNIVSVYNSPFIDNISIEVPKWIMTEMCRVIISACSFVKYDELEQKYYRLCSDYSFLSATAGKLEIQVKELETKNTELEKKYILLHTNFKDSTEQVDRLLTKNNKLKQSFGELNVLYDNVCRCNKELYADNQRLRETISCSSQCETVIPRTARKWVYCGLNFSLGAYYEAGPEGDSIVFEATHYDHAKVPISFLKKIASEI